VEPLTDTPVRRAALEAARQVTDLYQAHALGLVRLAVIMLGDQAAAEDVVQDAFLGLYRRWRALDDPERALAYVRASVVNGCRMVHRQQARRDRVRFAALDYESAEAVALIGEEHREVMAALHRLPARQREAVILRFYMELAEGEVAQVMGVSRGTVKSATSRGLATLGRMLREES
jgi:RNA polymerase sigma-70 factor (sigma-E family)